jgi:ABC-2 type transport system ATP-binding protein
MAILDLKDVKKSFRQGFVGKRKTVLRGVSLSLAEGEVYGFLGHNGAGKSTTIKLILGLLRPDAGEIRIFGERGVTQSSRARIGYLSEEIGLYPHLNAAEMLQLVGELFRLRGRVLEQRICELLELVGLADSGKLKIKHFSKGMRQRLGIAAALMNDPALLLLDEPYSGLDPLGRKQLRELLLSLKTKGKTILMSSHIVPDVEAVCDRVGILSGGVIARSLDLNEVYARELEEIEVTVTGVDADRLGTARFGAEKVLATESVTILRCREADRLEPLIKEIYRSHGKVIEVRPRRLDLENIFVQAISEPEGAPTSDERKKTDEMAFTR